MNENQNVVNGCTLHKSKSDCDQSECIKCGWNEKEIARRKAKINKGLVNINKFNNVPIYGIKINNPKRRSKRNEK